MSQILIIMYLQVKIFLVMNVNCRLELLIVLIRNWCSLEYKFCKKLDSLVNVTNNNIDIQMISDTKLDPSFPVGQFFIHGFSELYRLDRNSNGGGILLYILENL